MAAPVGKRVSAAVKKLKQLAAIQIVKAMGLRFTNNDLGAVAVKIK